MFDYIFFILIILVLISHFNCLYVRKWFQIQEESDPNYPVHYFQQTLDHSSPFDQRKFQQRYMVNDQFFDKLENGTAFLLIGGEGPINSAWMTSQEPIRYAETYNGIFFQLEHRYYGESGPLNDNITMSMEYLSASEALEDIAEFIVAMNEKYQLKKWIVIGGFYSGNLATWMRYKYPHLVTGAIAASAPVLAKMDFSEYLKAVESTIRNANKSCYDKIKNLLNLFETKLRNFKSRSMLQKKLNYPQNFHEIVSNNHAKAQLFRSLVSIFAEAVQYHRHNVSTLNIDNICATLSTSVVQSEKKFYPLYEKFYENTDFLQEDYRLDNWAYQVCDEFGYFQCSSKEKSIFNQKFPIRFNVEDCVAGYGEAYDEEFIEKAIQRTNRIFGGLTPEGLTNVISVHGSLDPWRILGFKENLNEKSPVLIVKGASHCAILYDSLPNEIEPPSLQEAREKVLNLIGDWID